MLNFSNWAICAIQDIIIIILDFDIGNSYMALDYLKSIHLYVEWIPADIKLMQK